MNIFDEIQSQLHKRVSMHEAAERMCIKRGNYLGAALAGRSVNECQETIKIVRELEKEYTVPCITCTNPAYSTRVSTGSSAGTQEHNTAAVPGWKNKIMCKFMRGE